MGNELKERTIYRRLNEEKVLYDDNVLFKLLTEQIQKGLQTTNKFRGYKRESTELAGLGMDKDRATISVSF